MSDRYPLSDLFKIIVFIFIITDSQLKACKEERRRVKQELEDEKERIAEALKPVVEGRYYTIHVMRKPVYAICIRAV